MLFFFFFFSPLSVSRKHLCISTQKSFSFGDRFLLPLCPAQPALHSKPDTSIYFSDFSRFLCCRCYCSMNPLLFAHVFLLRRCPVQSRAFQLEPGQSPAASQLFRPCLLHDAQTDLSFPCRHLAPLTYHTVPPLDLKIVKLFLCSAWPVILQTHPFA